jgi:hypothetical protein
MREFNFVLGHTCVTILSEWGRKDHEEEEKGSWKIR